jgi:citrate lyase subunit beta/citryl-CoA lyase
VLPVKAVADLRSLLFAPGSDERKLRRALESEADGVVADLEDAVALDAKAPARALVAGILREREPAAPTACVRINGVDTDLWEDDMAALEGLALDAIVVPKATPEAVEALGSTGPPLIAIVETAQGLRLAYETACSPRVAALALGAADLGAELRLEPRRDGQEILYARSKLVVDSAAAGVRAPFDVVHLDTRDGEGLEAETLFARSLGFGGKLCIHPAQVETVNRVFAADEEQLEWARRVVAAYERGLEEGRGAIAVEGEMVDLPIVVRARRLLERSERTKA